MERPRHLDRITLSTVNNVAIDKVDHCQNYNREDSALRLSSTGESSFCATGTQKWMIPSERYSRVYYNRVM